MNKNTEHEKHIAFIFSIILPGAGFLYLKKWLSGIVFMVIHLLITGLLFYKTITIIYYKLENIPRSSEDCAVLLFLFIGILVNWFWNVRATQNYE